MAVVMEKKKFVDGAWPLRSRPLIPAVPALSAVEKSFEFAIVPSHL